MDWLVLHQEWLALCWFFSFGVGIKFAQSFSHAKQGLIPEEIYQTPLSNKKQGNLD
jgi:hypothetical protein